MHLVRILLSTSSPYLDAVTLLGVTERLEFVDAPGHAEDLKRYRARGYAMKGHRIRIVTDRSMEVVEVHAPSVNRIEMTGVTVEYCPPHPAME